MPNTHPVLDMAVRASACACVCVHHFYFRYTHTVRERTSQAKAPQTGEDYSCGLGCFHNGFWWGKFSWQSPHFSSAQFTSPRLVLARIALFRSISHRLASTRLVSPLVASHRVSRLKCYKFIWPAERSVESTSIAFRLYPSQQVEKPTRCPPPSRPLTPPCLWLSLPL